MQTTTTETETAVPPIPPRPARTPRQYAGLLLRGMAMGASDIVPGVSGGTMAFILGIYEELIDSIRAVGQPRFLKAAFSFRIKEIFQILNWPFLLAVASGIIIAIFTMSSGLEWMLVNQPVPLWSFFFGLVLASVITVSKRITAWTPPLIGALLLAAVGAYLLVGAVPAQTPETWWFLLLSGAIAICAMILPGVSGAFILVLLGKYQFVLSAVNGARAFNIDDILTIALVGVGAMVGLVTFAQILGWLFKQYHNLTVAALTGLMVGSLRKVWPWKLDVEWLRDDVGQYVLSHGERMVTQQKNIWPPLETSSDITMLGIALLLAGLAFGAIMLLDRLASGKA